MALLDVTKMLIGYNTNGFAHHRLEDAVTILAEIGYRSIAITLDVNALNPYAPNFADQRRQVASLLEQYGLHCVIETGARFLLDPRVKHSPTLLDESPAGRERRRDFLIRAIDLARDLNSGVVSFWSGTAPAGLSGEQTMERLAEECRRLLDHADEKSVRLAFEPEPGMFIDTMAKYAELHRRLDHALFGLTLDVGHVHCLSDGLIADHLRAWQQSIFNVHLEDMRRGVHEHLFFGDGEMDTAAVLRELRHIDYGHGVHVELSRHSHAAVETAREAFAYLTRAMND